MVIVQLPLQVKHVCQFKENPSNSLQSYYYHGFVKLYES